MISLGKFLGPRAVRDAAMQEATTLTERWDVPHEVKVGGKMVPVAADLDDREPRWQGTRDGYPISGRLLADDFATGGPTPAAGLAFGVLPVAVIVMMILASIATPAAAIGVLAVLASLYLVSRVAGGGWVFFSAVLALVASAGSLSRLPLGAAALAQGSALRELPGGILGLFALVVVFFVIAQMMGMVSRLFVRTAVRIVGIMLAVFAAAAVLPSFLHPAIAFAPLLALPLLHALSEREEWAAQCAVQAKGSRGEVETGTATAHVSARLAQAVRAAIDGGPLLVLGEATGYLTSRLDGYAPDAGLPVGLTRTGLATHLAVIGETGSGKTSGALRPLIAQWAKYRLGGLLVLDGKGQLASELRGLRGYTVIEPGVALGLIEGLDENDLVEAIAGVAINRDKPSEGGEGFFTVNGQSVLYQGAVLLRALVRHRPDAWKWTLGGLHSLLADVMSKDNADKIKAILDALAGYKSSHAGQQVVFANAIRYFSEIAPGMDHETKANIWSTIHGWLSPIFEHEDLVGWSETEHGIDLSTIVHGAMFGMALPEVKYGRAGNLVQALVKQRVYSLLRKRGDGWKQAGEQQVLFVVDEAQELVGAGDEKFLPVARSLGGACVYASQSIDAFMRKLGPGADTWLGNLLSRVVLHSTPASMKWVALSLGTTMRPRFKAPSGYLRIDESVANLAKSPLFDPSHPGARMLRSLRARGAARLRTSHERWAREYGKRPLDTVDVLLWYGFDAVEQVEWEEGPLMSDAEVDAKLATPFTAIAQVQRGGVRRRDVIRLQPMFEFPPELLDGGAKEGKTSGDGAVAGVRKDAQEAVKGVAAPKPGKVAPAPQMDDVKQREGVKP